MILTCLRGLGKLDDAPTAQADTADREALKVDIGLLDDFVIAIPQCYRRHLTQCGLMALQSCGGQVSSSGRDDRIRTNDNRFAGSAHVLVGFEFARSRSPAPGRSAGGPGSPSVRSQQRIGACGPNGGHVHCCVGPAQARVRLAHIEENDIDRNHTVDTGSRAERCHLVRTSTGAATTQGRLRRRLCSAACDASLADEKVSSTLRAEAGARFVIRPPSANIRDPRPRTEPGSADEAAMCGGVHPRPRA